MRYLHDLNKCYKIDLKWKPTLHELKIHVENEWKQRFVGIISIAFNSNVLYHLDFRNNNNFIMCTIMKIEVDLIIFIH